MIEVQIRLLEHAERGIPLDERQRIVEPKQADVEAAFGTFLDSLPSDAATVAMLPPFPRQLTPFPAPWPATATLDVVRAWLGDVSQFADNPA